MIVGDVPRSERDCLPRPATAATATATAGEPLRDGGDVSAGADGHPALPHGMAAATG